METSQQPTLEQILAKMAQSMDGKVPPAIQAASEVMPEMVFEQMRSKGFAMPQENGALSEETRTLIYLGVALATNNHACVEAMMNKSKTMGIEKAKLLETVKIARYAEATRIIGNAETVFRHLKDEWEINNPETSEVSQTSEVHQQEIIVSNKNEIPVIQAAAEGVVPREVKVIVRGESQNPTRMNLTSGEFKMVIDEPENMGGTDAGPTPIQVLLMSLAGCLNVTGHEVAKQRGLKLNGLKVKIEGVMNPCAFIGCSTEERAGFQHIKVTVDADMDGVSAEEKVAWLEETENRCPVTDNIRADTSLSVAIS